MVINASLREQVYRYLRDQMHLGDILPGSSLNLNQISQQLGISKTPLRDALIQLECEGFVTIFPRRGVMVNALTLLDIKNFHEIIGSLEGFIVQAVFDRFSASHISRMEELNSEMIAAIQRENFDSYYELNLKFHDVFLNLSDNTELKKIILPMKQRLYDFPRRLYIKEWELSNCDEHQQLIDAIKKGDCGAAVHILKDVHWSFAVQEKYIRQFYFSARKFIKAELALQRAVGGN